MLVDDVDIKVSAGHGGKGAVAFNKNLMELGPAGGSGGFGGSVYAEGVEDISALRQFRFKKDWDAEDGEDGKPQFNDGKDGADLILKVPVGTVVSNLDTGTKTEIKKIGERVLVAKGGRGGKGNFQYRSPINTSPNQFQEGLPGETFNIGLELKLIADVGLIGLPNVGKSSLINELTNSNSKVANYPFTTLSPHLGAYYALILADIPGLIEGAAEGKGLGDKFLRHVERTKNLFHLVPATSSDPVKDYETVREELRRYNPELLHKAEFIFLSKSDEVNGEELSSKLNALRKINPATIAISIHDMDSLTKVKTILNRLQDQKKTKPLITN